MGEEGLRRLGVVEATMTDSSIWGPDGQLSTVKFISRSIPILSSFIDDLIKGWEDIICELHLSQ